MSRIVLVCGSYHREAVERMAATARDRAGELGLEIAAERWVPGALECPLALQQLLGRNNVDGAVLLGIIERGETCSWRPESRSAWASLGRAPSHNISSRGCSLTLVRRLKPSQKCWANVASA